MNVDLFDTMRMELRRGVLVLAVLVALRQEQYGYSLRRRLLAADIDIEEGTLYPLIRRLEGQGLLTSEWRDDGEGGRKRRYYTISREGEALLKSLTQEWESISRSVGTLMEGA